MTNCICQGRTGPARVAAREFVVFAADVPDRQVLIDGLRPGVQPYTLSGQGNGLAEIATLLAGQRDIQALHIISHGSPGQLHLGEAPLSLEILPAAAPLLGAIRSTLAEDAALLLYGCEVAKGAEGRAFIARLEAALGCDVAASQTPTGATALGGDWVLDTRSEEIAGNIAIGDLAISRYAHILTSPLTGSVINFGPASSPIELRQMTRRQPTFLPMAG